MLQHVMTDSNSSNSSVCRSRTHSLKTRRKFDSSESASHYIAVLGSNPTKMTLKRCQASSTSSSSRDLFHGQHSIDSSKFDLRNHIANVVTPAVACSKTSTTKLSQKKSQIKSNNVEAKLKSPIENEKNKKANDDQMVSHTKNSAVSKISETKSSIVQADQFKDATAHERKRGSSSTEDKTLAKKPRGLPVLSKSVVQSATTMNVQLPPKKNSSAAASLLSVSWKSANALHQMQQINNKFKQRLTSSPATSFSPPIVTAMPPAPPNWQDYYEETIMSLLTFKPYAIDSSTAEYRTIESMLLPIKVNQIKKIVNPDLWKRFINTRKEMLRSKSDDLNVLSELGLDERDVMRCTHLVLNQTKDPIRSQYSENMALLFHCTRNVTSLNNILSQGLDERLSNVFGGRLGKGIYFADDPQKSLQYDGTGRILIFAVLLGDCISVDHLPFKNALVREPEKCGQEMRNMKDLFFDSIVGRPAGYNEYVIYNRHQCCPLYEIEYERPVLDTQPSNSFHNAAQYLPPFAWLPDDSNYVVQVNKACSDWPFYAGALFKKMGAHPLQYESHCDVAPLTEISTEQMSTDKKLATLFTFGFADVDRNKEILSKFSNDLYQTLNYLLDNENYRSFMEESDPYSTSSIEAQLFLSAPAPTNTCSAVAKLPSTAAIEIPSTSNSTSKVSTYVPGELADFLLDFDASNCKSTNPPPPPEECSICYNEFKSFATTPELWKKLKCGHKICLACYSNLLTIRSTMSRVEQTFIKCPFCYDITGIQIGTCPDIQMTVTIIPNSCEGYESTNTISIKYFADSAYQLNRTAYLPNNPDGEEVLKLLKIACDRRLCFSIGESVTTGQKNVLVWGIHHKTSMRGGVSKYGYPDPEYINRVKLELKAYGIH